MSLGSSLSGFFGGQNNFQGAPLVTQDFTSPLNPINQNRIQQTSNLNDERTLAQALRDRSNGVGPSAADALLTQATSNNAAQAAGVYSGNRSLSAGLAARAAANQNAAANQTAAGQAAALRANEQNAATGQLEGLYGQVGTQAFQGEGIEQGALANQNGAINQGNSIAAGVAQNNSNNAQGATMGLINGLASAGAMAAAHGGVIPDPAKMAEGGLVKYPLAQLPGTAPANPNMGGLGDLGKALYAHFKSQNMSVPSADLKKPELGSELNTPGPSLGVGSLAPAQIVAPTPNLSVPSSELVTPDFLKARGGTVPGKAKVKGDSYSNDTVPTMLSPGEIVVDREHSGSEKAAVNFIHELMKKQEAKKMASGGMVHPVKAFGAVIEAQANLHKRLKSLEKKRSA